MSSWEPFTERARRVVVLAQEEARRLGNDHLGTEHLLLGLISEGESAAARVLRDDLGVTLDKARREVVAIAGRGRNIQGGEVAFTPRARRVLEIAREEANVRGEPYVGTEHLLVALYREREGIGFHALVALGFDEAVAKYRAGKSISALIDGTV